MASDITTTATTGRYRYPPGSKARLHFVATSRGKTLDDTRQLGRGLPFELRLGKQFVIPAWEEAVSQMATGQTTTVTFPETVAQQYVQLATVLRNQVCTCGPVWACVPHGWLINIGVFWQDTPHSHHASCGCMGRVLSEGPDGAANADLLLSAQHPLTVTFELLELVSLFRVGSMHFLTLAACSVELPGTFTREHWELTAAEKFQRLPAIKEQGNAHFRAKEFPAAVEQYSVALGYAAELVLPEAALAKDQLAVVQALQVPLLLNLSAACREAGDCPAAVAHASRALELVDTDGAANPAADPVATKAKALFRRGAAHLTRGRDPADALADLPAALALAPGDAAIAAAQAKATAAVAAAKQEDSVLLRRMFGGMGNGKV